MLSHLLRVIYRGYQKNRGSFLINLIGLSTALTCVLFIYLWVNDELSVDAFHEKDRQLYQAVVNLQTSNGVLTSGGSPPLLGPALLKEMPEVEEAAYTNVSFFNTEGMITRDEARLLARGLFASENLFDILSYELIEGDPGRVLSGKNNIVISRDLAEKLFPSTRDAMGQTLMWNVPVWDIDDVFQVSGVFEPPPTNATKQFDAVVLYDWMSDSDPNAALWPGGYAETYLVMKEGANIERFNEKIADFLKDKHPARENTTLFVQRYSERYLQGTYKEGVLVGGRITYVRLFSIIALFILAIACVNFMNLSTARAALKKKEIGVKKTIGASRRLLILQFLGESTILASLSMGVALLLVYLLAPHFNAIMGKQLALDINMNFVLLLTGIALVTGLGAGSYPALYLSGFTPQTLLKKSIPHAPGEQWIRKGLVIFQFTMTVMFIVGVLVIHNQLRYTQEKNLGYERDNVISFGRGPLENEQQNDALLAEIRQIPGVLRVSNMAGTIQWGQDNQSGYSWRGEEDDRRIAFKSPRIGYDVIETLDMEMLAGRSFSREMNDDASKIIINESALELMGLEDPVGSVIQYGEETRQIIGVVRDFNYGSLHQPIEPLIFRFREFGGNFIVKVRAGTEERTLSQLEEVYASFFPGYDFEYSFMDDDYQALYASENVVATLSKYFSILAILISCLGLLGLAMFVVERRTKEIGIRKILGSSEWGILYLLSRSFLSMVVIAILIALPISYIVANRWLNAFAYRIELSVWFFAVAAVATLLITWFTVSVHTIKAAWANPADSLRYE